MLLRKLLQTIGEFYFTINVLKSSFTAISLQKLHPHLLFISFINHSIIKFLIVFFNSLLFCNIPSFKYSNNNGFIS